MNPPLVLHRYNVVMLMYFLVLISLRADKLYDLLKEQSEILKELNQRSRQEAAQAEKTAEEKKVDGKLGLFGF